MRKIYIFIGVYPTLHEKDQPHVEFINILTKRVVTYDKLYGRTIIFFVIEVFYCFIHDTPTWVRIKYA